MFPSRFVQVEPARRCFGDRVDRLGSYLTRVDSVADEALAAIDTLSAGEGMRLFDRAVKLGSASVPDAPDALRALFAQVERVPPWVDWDALDRGGRVLLRAGGIGGMVLGLKSLVLGYTSPAGNKPLVLSGRLHDQAGARLHETACFVRATIAPGGLRPHAPGWRTTLKVRLVHARVRRLILASGQWDPGAWGMPINQHDQAGTSLLFSSAVLEGLRQLGLRVTQPDAEAYMQLWRWSGYLMGIDPELLAATEGEGERLGAIIAATQGSPDEDSRTLTRALLSAPLRAAKTEEEWDRARRIVSFSTAVCRRLLGETLADALAVPRTSWRFVVPVFERVVAGMEAVRRRLPFAEQSAQRAGVRYWEGVVHGSGPRAGMGGEIPIPRTLSRAVSRAA